MTQGPFASSEFKSWPVRPAYAAMRPEVLHRRSLYLRPMMRPMRILKAFMNTSKVWVTIAKR